MGANPQCKGGALGTMPLGGGALGTGVPGGIFLSEAIDFSTIRISTTPQDPVDMLDVSLWSVVPTGLGAPVTVVSVTQVVAGVLWELKVDPLLTPGEEYLVTFDQSGFEPPIFPVGCDSITVTAPPAPPAVAEALQQQDLPYDIANPHLVRDAGIVDPPPLGQYQVNDRGDFALDSRIQGLRKRILRRISTQRGGFFHLPEYGFAQPIKGPVRPGELRNLAVDARAQVEREPEVIRAQVAVQQLRTNPNVVVLTVRARTITGLDVVANQTLDLRPPARS